MVMAARQGFVFIVLSGLLAIALAGCLGGDDAASFKPTGRTVELDVWVEDHTQTVYPGLEGLFWAFCVRARAGSEDVVRYMATGSPCSVPGPEIRVQQGDRVIAYFENPHGFPHTIHWHGQHVPHDADGVPGVTQDTVVTGGSYTYDFIASRPGTQMYHCHVDTQHHVFMGLYGSLIVEPQNQKTEPKVDRDYTLVISHADRAHLDVAGGDPHGGEPGGEDVPDAAMGSGEPGKQNAPFNPNFDVFMFNGQSYPETVRNPATLHKVKEGETVRLRFVNIGFFTETMHLHGHEMLETHKDGLPLSKGARYLVDTLAIAPGERYDVVFKAEHPGTWVLHTHMPHHVTNDQQYPGGMKTKLVYEGLDHVMFELAELPGGQPSRPAGPAHGTAPDDYDRTVSGSFMGLFFRTHYEFPVESTRIMRVLLTLELEHTTPVPTPFDFLELSVVGMDDDVLATARVDMEDPQATVLLEEVPRAGTFLAKLDGQGVGAGYRLQIQVEYEADEDDPDCVEPHRSLGHC
jgi:FtsP/CotA-like multicopper oxidase with cupredoxin domain